MLRCSAELRETTYRDRDQAPIGKAVVDFTRFIENREVTFLTGTAAISRRIAQSCSAKCQGADTKDCAARWPLQSSALGFDEKGIQMQKFTTALTASALLALGACGGGGGSETAANNSAEVTATDTTTLPPDENAAAGAGGDTLSDQLNALETTNALGNQVTENGTANTATSDATGNAAGNTTGNTTGNSQ